MAAAVSISMLAFIDPACALQVHIYSQSFEGRKNPFARRAVRTVAVRAHVQECINANRNTLSPYHNVRVATCYMLG